MRTRICCQPNSAGPSPPSFPTRRSSDLQARVAELRREAETLDQRLDEARGELERLGVEAEAASARRQVIEERRVHLDRKSTRLNSSHVKISYAVFCLKK